MKTAIQWTLMASLVIGASQADEKALPDASIDEVSFGSVVNEVEFSKDQLDGKVVVVESWGTRCGPCIAFLPELAKIHRRYEKKGLKVVGMEVQNSEKEDIVEILDDARVDYPVTKGGRVPVEFRGIPHACVFGADGKLVWAGNPHDDEFVDSIKDALRDADDVVVAKNDEEAEPVEASGPMIAMREWTNAQGNTMRAEVVAVNGDRVTFRMGGSREVEYKIADLSEEDQALIREAAEG